ncbi:nucleotidyltransferase family protein [candidate division KSB1 bacterium]|nr:nucleotidyltransferase family protein [candidate division KSB1 bacterium]
MEQGTETLLYCLKADVKKISAAELKRISSVEWENVVELSIKHSVAPLLYQRLKSVSSEVAIPVNIVNRLHKIYLNSAARNMRLFNELSEVLRILQDDGIPVIVLKGAHLAEIVYNNLALRPMEDVDLMVKKADLPRVAEKFLKMGYNSTRPININELSSTIRKPTFTNFHNNYFDIHWTIEIDSFKIDVASLWEKTQSATIAGVKTLVLAPEDLLLYLALHASFNHAFYWRLISLCDIALTIWHYKDEIDWNQLHLRAKQWGVDKCLYLTLYLADKLLEASIPTKVLDALKSPDFDVSVAALAEQIIFDDNNDALPLPQKFSHFMRRKNLRDKAIFFLKRVFPSPEVIASMYQVHSRSKKIYLYYPVNLKDLLLDHGRKVWKLLCRDKKMVSSVKKVNTMRDWLTSG